ncbi:MAG: hypothetical protein JWM99_2575, partial [Verrucomicrobiales bacterium]|nr:hypothetical protein [Verrucomicrobiales bacterium]
MPGLTSFVSRWRIGNGINEAFSGKEVESA